MGGVLAERELGVDLMVTSSAVRAQTTCHTIALALDFPLKSIVVEPRIYHASVATLMLVIVGLDESASSAVLFGHNPGFHDLVNTLVPGYPVDHYPTCGVARIELDIEHWGNVSEGCGRLVEFLFPKQFV